jgi:hypothetical protein
MLECAPAGFYAALMPELDDEVTSGALFCLRDAHRKVQADANYALAPYFLVYVADTGEVKFNHLQGKKSLDILKKLCSTRTDVDTGAEQALAKATRNGRDMGHYQFLLERAISSVFGKVEETGVESLFSRGGTVLSQDHFSALEDFEVVSYVIVVGRDNG